MDAEPRLAPHAIAAAAIALAFAATGHGAGTGSILYVDADAPPDGDGTSWASAHRLLQDALAAAPVRGATEIRVAGGLYQPDRDAAHPLGSGDRLAAFDLVDGAALRGGYAGAGEIDPDARDLQTWSSVLSGDLLGDDGSLGATDNSYHVVRANGLSAATTLGGFTITAGRAVSAPGTLPRGGAIELVASDLVVIDCTFLANGAEGTYSAGGAVFSAAGRPTFERCVFSANVVTASFQTVAGGGALYVLAGAVVIDCTFAGNAAGNGGAIFTSGDTVVHGSTFEGNDATRGGAIHRTNAGGSAGPLIAIDSTFTSNTAASTGGAIDLYASDPGVAIERCAFLANHADTNDGGAINAVAGGTSIANTLFAGNNAADCGGAVRALGGAPRFAACTFTRNAAAQGGGVCVTAANGQPVFLDSILWKNSDVGGTDESAQIDHGPAPAPVVHYCDVEGWTGAYGGAGNVNVDPSFVDGDGPDGDPNTVFDNDFRLSFDSPCLDAGNNWGLPADAVDLDGDGDVNEATPFDLDGAPRFAGAPSAPDTGCGVPVMMAIGAYEGAGAVHAVRRGDLTGDGVVGFADLTAFLIGWGPCDPAQCCLGDLNLNGDTGAADLFELLQRWGG